MLNLQRPVPSLLHSATVCARSSGRGTLALGAWLALLLCLSLACFVVHAEDRGADSGASAATQSPTSAPPRTPLPSAHWTYSSPKTGPYNWANLDPGYSACAAGQRQSPVDIKLPDATHPAALGLVRVDPRLRHILFNYEPSNVTLLHNANVTHTDQILNNGHTAQVDYESGSSLTVGGKRFDLRQFHFHSPSEHTFNGRHADMEMHLVHSSPGGALVVVALLLEVPHGVVGDIRAIRGQYSALNELTDDNSGPEVKALLHKGSNAFLDSLRWDRMPRSSTEFLPILSDQLNIFDILPFDQGYITYSGSLTTPPCSEIVEWYVLKSPIPCSLAQKNQFQAIFGQNARPTQLLHGRNVTMTLDSMDPQHSSSPAPGVSHDVFLALMGGLIVVSLLLLFAILFICTRTQHRLGRAGGFGEKKLYSILSPAKRADDHAYQAINPLEDELENGNRYRATAQIQAQAAAPAVRLDDAPYISRPSARLAGDSAAGGPAQTYGSL